MAREMKNSGIPWIGEIPSDWDVSTLGKFISIDSGISVGKKYEPETPLVEVPYLRVANVQGDHLDLSDVATIWVTPEEAEKYRLKPGQLLMTEGGDRDKLGRGCLWNGEIEGCIHQNHVFAVQTDNRLLVRYLDYLTTSEVARIYFDVTAKKTTNLACTSKSTIQKFVIPVPTVDEQRVISKYLDRKCAEIDAVLEKTYASIEEYKKLKQAIIAQAVTKGIQRDRPMKESGIEWASLIPSEWESVNPKALFSQRKEKAVPGERQLTSSQKYGIVYQDDYMELTGSRVVVVQKDFDILKHVEAGDFIISMRSFQGGLEYSTKSGSISSAYVMLAPNLNLVYPRFYRWLLKSEVYIRALQRTSNMVRDGQAMRYSNFGQIRLYTVPLQEQIEIADYLDEKCATLDALIDRKEKFVSEIESYKKSLIYEYVTGKKEVI